MHFVSSSRISRKPYISNNLLAIMGFLNIFKKKPTTTEETKSATTEELPNYLETKLQETKEKEKEILEKINDNLILFYEDIEEKTKILESFSLEEKKVELRIKIIVKQGFKKYLEQVSILINELKKTNHQSLTEAKTNLIKIINKFYKQSNTFYQQANYLIGDELFVTKTRINKLENFLIETFNNNAKTINTLTTITSLKSKLKNLGTSKENLVQVKNELKYLDKNIEQNNQKISNLREQIKQAKTSKEYLDNLKAKEQLSKLQSEKIQLIQILNKSINMKSLSNLYHSNEKQINIIKNYKNNFSEAFQKNNGEDILDLIDDKSQINKIINKIEQNKKLSQETTEQIKEETTTILQNKIQNTNHETETLISKKPKNQKRQLNIQQTINETKQSIADQAKTINLILT